MLKAKVIEIKRFAVHDGDGIRTTVFLKGCPLKCVWCHNPESIRFEPELSFFENKCTRCGMCVEVCSEGVHILADERHTLDRDKCVACGRCETACLSGALKLEGRQIEPAQLLPALLRDRDFYESSNGGVTISGGECLTHPDFCAELLRLLKEEGIHTAVDTCGFVPRAAIDQVMPYTDIFLYDLKAFHEDVHIRCTGRPNALILENLRYLDRCGAAAEIRIPFVPGWNDGELEAIGRFLTGLNNITKVRVLPYHNYARSKYKALDMADTLPADVPDEARMTQAKKALSRLLDTKGISVE